MVPGVIVRGAMSVSVAIPWINNCYKAKATQRGSKTGRVFLHRYGKGGGGSIARRDQRKGPLTNRAQTLFTCAIKDNSMFPAAV